MNKTIKLQDIWVSDTNSNKGDVFKTMGFKTLFCYDRWYEPSESWLYYNKNGVLTRLPCHEKDITIFNNENDAKHHQLERKKYWIDWHNNEAKEHTEKANELMKGNE